MVRGLFAIIVMTAGYLIILNAVLSTIFALAVDYEYLIVNNLIFSISYFCGGLMVGISMLLLGRRLERQFVTNEKNNAHENDRRVYLIGAGLSITMSIIFLLTAVLALFDFDVFGLKNIFNKYLNIFTAPLLGLLLLLPAYLVQNRYKTNEKKEENKNA